MCGIIGFNYKSNNIDSILELTKHRGPDNIEKLEINNWTFGHNRLSIVDHNPLSNQPFVSSCGRYVIVFNGEVYNHNEIREKLKNKYSFKTSSDTEVILYAYIEYGEKSLDYFRGMFAFSIYDKEKDILFAARDRIGIKPFVYYFKDHKFIFASEIQLISQLIDRNNLTINMSAIGEYLKYLYIAPPKTIFNEIHKLPPAHFLVLKNNKIIIQQYWNIEQYIGKNKDLTEEEILQELDELFDESIKMRMIADVELGSFLSGGIDSSLILYYMQKNSKDKINTYTLGFENADKYDETDDANIMARYFKTKHQEIIIKPDIISLLPKMIKHFGEPFASPTSLLIHELTKETKKLATVALAGDGGDEVFGGYPKYEALLLTNKVKFIPKIVWKSFSYIIDFLPENTEGNHFLRRLKTFIKSLLKDKATMYDEWSSYITDDELNKLFANKINYDHIVKNLWNEQKVDDDILRSSIVDLKSYLPNDMLYYGDIMSMANSFEVRFPLIDHKIIEFLTSIDSKYRIKDGKTKYLMKKLLEKKVPKEILNKKKLGLNPPMGIWLKKDLKNLINEYLSKEIIEKRKIFDYEYIKYILDSFYNNKKDYSLTIWSLIVLEEWFRQNID